MVDRDGYSGNAVTQAIKDRLNIVELVRRYVNLKRVGNRWVGPCPFHQETKGSFSVNEEQGFFYCFGCQASGDIFDFYGRINGLNFKETLAQLAEETAVSLKFDAPDAKSRQQQDIRKRSLKMHDLAQAHFKKNLASLAGSACREYVALRRLDAKIAESFELGWSLPEWHGLGDMLLRAGFSREQGVESGLLIKGEHGSFYDRFRSRLMFSIKNLSGNTIAFGGRIIDDADTAKYINSSDSPIYKKGDNLYGLFQARRAIAVKKSVLLTEGYMDVLTLHQFGYENACGVLGTALTPEQIKRLSGFCSDFELIFDGDAPGRKAALRSCEMILTRGLKCRVVLLPDTEDIDSLLKNFGPKAFEDLRSSALDGLAFCMRVLNGSFAPREISSWVKDFLSRLEHPELTQRYVKELSRGLGLDEISMYGQASAHGITSIPSAHKTKAEAKNPDTDRQFLAFALRYPKYADRLRDAGLEFVLAQPWACALWSKIIACAPDYAEAEILASLDQQEKELWILFRAVEIMPVNQVKEKLELIQICETIKRIIHGRQNTSRMQALSTLKGDAYENELLRAFSGQYPGKSIAGEKNE